MKKLSFAILWIKPGADTEKLLTLLEEHKKQIMDTGHFTDVQIKKPFRYSTHIIVVLFPKSDQAWEEYNTNNRTAIRQWFVDNVGALVEVAGSLISENELGLSLYRAGVEDYTKYFKKITEGWTPDMFKEAMGVFDTHDYDKIRIWTAFFNGMELALNLSEEQVKNISEEYMQKVQI